MLFFSKRTNGFYDDTLHQAGTIPDDAVEISQEQWQALMEGQARGQSIGADEHGQPVLTPEVTAEERAAQQAKGIALARLEATDVLVIRYLERGALSAELATYREQLREVIRGHETALPTVPTLPSLRPAV